MAERAYTVREIEDMRCAVRILACYGRVLPSHERARRMPVTVEETAIEERLRTYMLHGTAPEELIAEANTIWAESQAKRTAAKVVNG